MIVRLCREFSTLRQGLSQLIRVSPCVWRKSLLPESVETLSQLRDEVEDAILCRQGEKPFVSANADSFGYTTPDRRHCLQIRQWQFCGQEGFVFTWYAVSRAKEVEKSSAAKSFSPYGWKAVMLDASTLEEAWTGFPYEGPPMPET